jgi:homoserine kinase type II
MAVYTDVPAEELALFLCDYELGELLAYKGIAEGVENSNFLVHTGRGYFILTLYEKRVAPGDLPFFLGLMEHLANKGLTCPQPVKNRRGAVLGMLGGRPAAIVTFLEGMWIRHPSAGHCSAVGEAVAKLHRAGADFPLKRANALSVAGWRPLFQAAAARADEVRDGLTEALDAELSFLEHASAPRRDPRRSVPRQRILSSRFAFGSDRLLLRLHRHARLRFGDLPQCLVL